MKVVILAGGKGSRISHYTQKIPKPMVTIGNIPMLTHIMDIFKFYYAILHNINQLLMLHIINKNCYIY